ncbi:hypothetical protein NEFER03_0414 [Nematocida sp. LUAm3]|nr:hypothetical protein NEFER03_0414 [Nematocida sp. LUAm3]KAI5175970.1 hypothetical protein NEFER02_1816 [Nematocida sp. LUAm2]KAI5179066.1 hypothetical protein NEFER01_1933 [Nematocida sp. LUAm1]
MRASDVLKQLIVMYWAEEIATRIEDESVLVTFYDPVVSAWYLDISEFLPEVTIVNSCYRLACGKACFTCVRVDEALHSRKDVLVNVKATKLLFVKIKALRNLPIKRINIDRSSIRYFSSENNVFIVDASEELLFLPPLIYSFFASIDRTYDNPVLIYQMVRYLEFEKTVRINMKNQNHEEIHKEIIHGLKVSFFTDPIVVESSRLHLYRQNHQETQNTAVKPPQQPSTSRSSLHLSNHP